MRVALALIAVLTGIIVARLGPRRAAAGGAEPRKTIFVKKNGQGFGNKVLDLIFAVYLYNYYRGACAIKYVMMDSKHERAADPRIDSLFPLARRKVQFVSLEHFRAFDVDKIYDYRFGRLPAARALGAHTRIENHFQDAYKMWATLSRADQRAFTDFRPGAPAAAPPRDYAVVHVRYGDKLADRANFALFTPEYYRARVRAYRAAGLDVVVITDTPRAVARLVMPEFAGDGRVAASDRRWDSDFQLMLGAKRIAMSASSFSICASYLNPGARCDIDLFMPAPPETLAAAPNWVITRDPKNILNLDPAGLREVQECA